MIKTIKSSLALLLLFLASCEKAIEVKRNQFELPENVAISDCEVGKYGGVFVITLAGEPRTFNPLIITDLNSSTASAWTTGALVEFNPITQEHVPALATSWEVQEDNKTYIFNLRKGVKFSDGEPFTADDVIFTFDTIFAPLLDADGNVVNDKTTGKPILRYPSRSAGQYTIGGEPISYRKIDSHTVEFKTKTVYAPFINDISYLEILPKHKLYPSFLDGTLHQQWSTETAINNPSEILSLGPFQIFSYRPGERLVLSPNPHYWKADKENQRLPYIDFLIFKFVADTNTAAVLFATGQSDAALISANDYTWIKKYQETYDFNVIERGPDTGIQFLFFNQNNRLDAQNQPYIKPYKLEWFTDKNFRQAIMYAINRQGLIDGSFFGRAAKINSIISQANKKWYHEGVKKYDFNPEKSKQLLKDSGFTFNKKNQLLDKHGNEVEFSIMISEGSLSAMNTATTIVENLKEIGIKVKLTALDFSALVTKVNDSFDYESIMMGLTGGGDPSGGKAIYRSDGFLHMWNPRQVTPQTEWESQVDALMDLQETQLDYADRKKTVDAIQDIFAEEVPLIFLTVPYTYSGVKSHWKNIKVPPINSILWNLEELYKND